MNDWALRPCAGCFDGEFRPSAREGHHGWVSEENQALMEEEGASKPLITFKDGVRFQQEFAAKF